MPPKKLKILLIFATLCITLFGALFRIMTSATNNEQITTNNTNEITTNNNEPLGVATTGTITDISGVLPSANGDLTILMPGRFYNEGFAQLAQLIKDKYKLTLHFKKIDNIGYYKKIIEGKDLGPDKGELEGIDLYLLPTDWLAGYQSKLITMSEDISPYVHPIFATLFGPLNKGRSETGGFVSAFFLPFVIDPLVTLTPTSTILPHEGEITFQDIAHFISLQDKTNKIKMPIIRGIDKNDKKILEQSLGPAQRGNESYPNYFIITYNIINQIFTSNQESNYKILLDTINNLSVSKRSYANFKITFNKLIKKNPNCAIFSDICIIAYNYGDIKFGFLSDVSIQKKYFGGTGSKITELSIYNFPTPNNDYKIRGRGFVVDKNTLKDKAIEVFAKEYIKVGANNSIPLRQDSLSAFNAILDTQKIQKKYELIFAFEPQFSLMFYPTNLQQQFLTTTNFLTMIENKNPATGVEGFFEPTNRNR